MTNTQMVNSVLEVHDVQIGVIGGSGLYQLDGYQVLGEVRPETPWGYPSDSILICSTPTGHKIAFLARHGRGHYLNPSEVPFKANIAALKKLGVKVILAYSAVGSLREEVKPRDFIIPDQVIDRTKGIRDSTFYKDGVIAHVSLGEPFCKELGEIITNVAQTAVPDVTFHTKKTLVCMEGPAFSTRAESHLYRSWGGDIINMSCVPECKLAREAEIAYQMICMATDYDCWKEHEEPVTVDVVVGHLSANAGNAAKLLTSVLPVLLAKLDKGELKSVNELDGSIEYAVMTAKPKRNKETEAKLAYILPRHFS